MNDDIWRTACAAAIAGLPGFGPGRIDAVLDDMPPEVAWTSLAEQGRAFDNVMRTVRSTDSAVVARFRSALRAALRRTEPLEVLERYERAGMVVWTRMGDYPLRLLDVPEAPTVLFAKGVVDALVNPTVALIGTRHCTAEGRRTATRLGSELAEAGVSVVSGLALGVDGAAHQGVVDSYAGAPPIGVVGSGLDVVYPKRHAGLWDAVSTKGLLLSEAALGAPPERWRFPARNRIIAGLADVVVVVESHAAGGSLLTVNDALALGRDVMAVPGSVNSPASRGTNALLRDGCAPVLSADDILTVLSLRPVPGEPVTLPPLAEDDDDVLEAVDWQPTTTSEVMERTGLPLGHVAEALTRLQDLGYLVGMGGWWQRVTEVGEAGEEAG